MKKWLLIGLCTLVTASCMKKLQDEEDNDPGPAASAQEVYESVAKAWGEGSLADVKKDEFAYFETEQRIQDMAPILTQQQGITTSKREVQDQKVNFTFLVQTNEIRNGESKLSTVEKKITYDQTLAASSMVFQQNVIRQKNAGWEIIYAIATLCLPAQDWDVTCHNLHYSEELRPAPALVKEQINCADIPNCEIRARKITFDLILKTQKDSQEVKKQKYQYTIVTSPDVPYLSRLMDFCTRGLVDVPSAGQKILVNVCNQIRNFKPGQN